RRKVGRKGLLELAVLERTHDLGQRPKRDALAVGKAPARHHSCPFRQPRGQFGGEARLADSRRPEHRENAARALLDRALERVLEVRELVATADQRKVEPAREAWRVAVNLADAAAAHLVALPLDGDALERARGDGVPDER